MVAGLVPAAPVRSCTGVLIIFSCLFLTGCGQQRRLGHASRATQDRKHQACQAAHGHAGFLVNSRVRADVMSARHLIGVKCPAWPAAWPGQCRNRPATGLCRTFHCRRASQIMNPREKPGVIQGGMVAAIAADKLEHVGGAPFWLALHDPGRLAPQNQSPVVPPRTQPVPSAVRASWRRSPWPWRSSTGCLNTAIRVSSQSRWPKKVGELPDTASTGALASWTAL